MFDDKQAYNRMYLQNQKTLCSMISRLTIKCICRIKYIVFGDKYNQVYKTRGKHWPYQSLVHFKHYKKQKQKTSHRE